MTTSQSRATRYLVVQARDIREYQRRNPGASIRELVAIVEAGVAAQAGACPFPRSPEEDPMSNEDITPEAYAVYLDQFALFQKQWPNLAGQPKTFEEWTEAMQHRDHPLWPAYVRARRDWKAATFHLRYTNGAVGSIPGMPTFTEWLAEQPESEDQQ